METRRVSYKHEIKVQYLCNKCNQYTDKDKWFVRIDDNFSLYECPNCGDVLRIGKNNDKAC